MSDHPRGTERAGEGRGPRTVRDVHTILRYWLGALRHEEALASRPRAQRPTKRTAPINVLEPSGGQPYFRLGAEHAPLLVAGKGMITLPVDGPVLAFFEHWLRATYRREALAARFEQRLEDEATRWIVGWPAILFERREELATVIQFPIELAWMQAGEPWRVPTFADRKARRAPGLPDQVVIRALESGDEADVVIDRELLARTLAVSDEDLEALERAAAGRDFQTIASAVLATLEVDPAASDGASSGAKREVKPGLAMEAARKRWADVPSEETFAAFVNAARRRVPEGVSVYPVGLVRDGALLATTYHLQREVLGLLDLEEEPPLSKGTALWSYLTGTPISPGWAELRGRYRARGLTQSQRDAAEHALGSTLAAVQGPPGTGKTELILNLASHAIVRRIEALADGRPMDWNVLVVASTNNRAVDNVIDPLARDVPPSRLPLALRAGSQEVTATITRELLERARRWLAQQDDREALGRLGEALDAFRRAREVHDRAAKGRVSVRESVARRAELEAQLAALGEDDGEGGEGGADVLDVLERFELVIERLRRAAERLGKPQLDKVERTWAELGAPILDELRACDPELAEAFSLPPELAEDVSDRERRTRWQECLDEAAEEVAVRVGELEAGSSAVYARAVERRRIATELEALQATPASSPIDEAEVEALAHAMFVAATEVRERWAVVNRPELLLALESAIEAAKDDRSLRRFFDDDRRGRMAILRLFPVMGSTLLSLGNVFTDAGEEIDRLVIDEAGQCHPAYAISGLLRAKRALLIGDVHQLPPVAQMVESDEVRVKTRAKVKLSDAAFSPYRVHAAANTSAQALADRAVSVRPTLVDHFRCQKEIIELSDALAGYGLVVHTPRRSLASRAPILSSPVLFGSVPGAQSRVRGSWANEAEAELLVELLLGLRRAGIPWSELGVLTPYVGQLERLRALLRPRGVPIDVGSDLPSVNLDLFGGTSADDSLAIGTVHRFQGGERSVILFSTVLTEKKSLTFLDDRPNLLNVAVSRARDHLVILGDPRTLREGRHTRLLVDRARPLRLS